MHCAYPAAIIPAMQGKLRGREDLNVSCLQYQGIVNLLLMMKSILEFNEMMLMQLLRQCFYTWKVAETANFQIEKWARPQVAVQPCFCFQLFEEELEGTTVS